MFFLASLRLSKEKNVKNELDHLKKNLLKKPKTIQIFLPKKLDPDQVQLFRIRIPPSRKVPDTTGSRSITLQKKHQPSIYVAQRKQWFKPRVWSEHWKHVSIWESVLRWSTVCRKVGRALDFPLYLYPPQCLQKRALISLKTSKFP